MSIPGFTSAPLDFRIRGRWVAATIEEVARCLAARPAGTENPDEFLRPAADALRMTTTTFEESWRRLMEVLESTGMPGHFLQPLAGDARVTLDKSTQLISLLLEHTHGYGDELLQATDTLARIGRELEAIEKSLVPGEVDQESMERGLWEAARGDGEDSGAVMARFLSTGEL